MLGGSAVLKSIGIVGAGLAIGVGRRGSGRSRPAGWIRASAPARARGQVESASELRAGCVQRACEQPRPSRQQGLGAPRTAPRRRTNRKNQGRKDQPQNGKASDDKTRRRTSRRSPRDSRATSQRDRLRIPTPAATHRAHPPHSNAGGNSSRCTPPATRTEAASSSNPPAQLERGRRLLRAARALECGWQFGQAFEVGPDIGSRRALSIGNPRRRRNQ